MGTNYSAKKIFITALTPTPSAHIKDLCVKHYDLFKAPLGWEVSLDPSVETVDRTELSVVSFPVSNVVTLPGIHAETVVQDSTVQNMDCKEGEYKDQEPRELEEESLLTEEELFAQAMLEDSFLDPYLHATGQISSSQFINGSTTEARDKEYQRRVHPARKNVPSRNSTARHLKIITDGD